MKNKLKYVYVLFLLITVCLLVLIAQGLFWYETTYTKPVEFNRKDGFNEYSGNMTEISVSIRNDDSINHNYSIQAIVDYVNYSNEYVEVVPMQPFTYSIQMPVEKKYLDNKTVLNESIKNISLKVYRDDRSEPLDQIEFTFNK